MTAELLLDCIGMIDDKYIEEAESYSPAVTARKTWHVLAFAAMAACICVIAAAAVFIIRYNDYGYVDITCVPESEETSAVTNVPETRGESDENYAAAGGITEDTEAVRDDSEPVVFPPFEGTAAETTVNFTTSAKDHNTVPPMTEELPTVETEEIPYFFGGEIRFDSFKQMLLYTHEISAMESEDETDGWSYKSYLSTVEGLYVVRDICDDEYLHDVLDGDDITQIIITPTYTETDFTMYGKNMQLLCYHGDESDTIEHYDNYIKENGSESTDKFEIQHKSDSGELYTVHCYKALIDGENKTWYFWEQDGKYFELIIQDCKYLFEGADYCYAEFCPFNAGMIQQQ